MEYPVELCGHSGRDLCSVLSRVRRSLDTQAKRVKFILVQIHFSGCWRLWISLGYDCDKVCLDIRVLAKC